MIEHHLAELANGTTLSCRAIGQRGAPVLVFLHGFPEAAFVWDNLLEHFGGRYRCVAPNLRGYERSSTPADVDAYRARHLVADLSALIDSLGGCVEALIAHDWGGAVAWNLAAQQPATLKRLVIINSPHPATFLRDLQTSPAQQAASAYMNFLCRPDAEVLLAEKDFARMWPLFENMGAADPGRPGGGWLTPAVRDQYRAVWRLGLTGPCNYYRASPVRPPTSAGDPMRSMSFAPEFVSVRVPTLVVWAEDDIALLPGLLDGLDEFVPDLRLVRIAGASHWVVHERPERVAAEIDHMLAG